MNLASKNTLDSHSPIHTLSQPGSLTHQTYNVNGVDSVASQHNSSGGSGSNYLLMRNVNPTKSSSESFHTINPSLYYNTPSNGIINSTPPLINPSPHNNNSHLHLASNTIKQQIQLPLTYTPPQRNISNINLLNNKLTSYIHQNPITQQQQNNCKFQYMQLKTAYQQLKQSHQSLLRDYEIMRQRIVVVRNNEEVLVGRNDQLLRSNGILQTKVYQLEEELKSIKANNHQIGTNVARYHSTSIIKEQHQQQHPSPRATTIRPFTPINGLISQPIITATTPPTFTTSPITQSIPPRIISTPSLMKQTYHPSLLQLQHQNRQLLYRVQQYQSSIVYKNSQLQKLSQQLNDKNIEINSLRRQLQAYIQRQSLYKQNQQLLQSKSQQLFSLNHKLQHNLKQYQQLKRQYKNLQQDISKKQQTIDQLKKNQLIALNQLEVQNKQLEKDSQQFKRIITNLQKINNQHQIAASIHKQLLQSIYSNQQNQTQILPSDLLYQTIPTQDFSKVLTTYIGDQTAMGPQQQNDYSKINSTIHHNVKNEMSKQNMAVMRLAGQLHNDKTYASQTNTAHYHSQPHNSNSSYQQQNNNQLLVQLSQGISKDIKHFNLQPTNSKLNIQDQTYFDFNKQNGETQPQIQKPSISPNISIDNLKPQHSQQRSTLIDKLTPSFISNQYYQSSNILSFPQLPFTLKQEDLIKHHQKLNNTVTFADNVHNVIDQDYPSDRLKPKRHNRIFPPTTETNPTTISQNSLETLQHRIIQLSQQNKSLRQYLVKKCSS